MRFMLLCMLFIFTQVAEADGAYSSQPDEHAPIGVMGDHMHKAGEWMLSYRFMHMSMSGNRKGSDAVSTAAVLGDFMVAPLNMEMDMAYVRRHVCTERGPDTDADAALY